MAEVDFKSEPPERVVERALPYFETVLPRGAAPQHPGAIVEGGCLDWTTNTEICSWLAKIILLLLPQVERLEQLPERASFIFRFDPGAALAENAELLRLPHADAVLSRFTAKVLEVEGERDAVLTPDQFKAIFEEVKAETGAKGKDLQVPVRILLTGAASGPELERLVPIIEEGSRLQLSAHVLSVRERVMRFQKVKTSAA
jgi:glutamyl/glutaminyl-tRNA synthetase